MDTTYNAPLAERAAQELWIAEKTYAARNNPGPLYSIDTPPPTVSGSLHTGHIFSYTQTDIIARYKRMSGLSVYYPFGFDDNGLPTERYVEKKLGIASHTMSRSAFIELCLQETQLAEKQFKELWQHIGLSVDWTQSYSTIGTMVRALSQASFIELYKNGYIYRKNEPALYCTTCRTSVAQAELEDAEKPGLLSEIIFTTSDGMPVRIATTRPELLPSCVALIYNPADTRYKNLKGKMAQVPLYTHTVPILEDERVAPDKGSGLVMCCTFGDSVDVEWFKKFNLPYRPSVGKDGKFLEDTGMLAGKKVAEAREAILEAFAEHQLVGDQKPIMHAVNIHERCKKEIEYLMLPQWFLKILPFKEKFIELGDQITWYPEFMKARYKNWVENISWDWGLSRQRFYGIPFPVWHCSECGEILLADENDLPVDPQETACRGICPACPTSTIVPDTDVMDTWNTSSLTPYICRELYQNSRAGLEQSNELFLPMSMRPQAHDIIRTWAFYTIVKTWMHDGVIPWKDIVISGHVLSNEKEKLSKSKGNSARSPEDLLKLYPADAIRFWTASGALGQDIAFSEQQIKIGQRLITKLWNAFRFVHQHTQGYRPSTEYRTETWVKSLAPVHQWIIAQAHDMFKRYTDAFSRYEFSIALEALEKFFWHDFCDNYLECIKDQLFNSALYTVEEVEATREMLYTIGLRILQLYAPFVPHVTETIYGALYKQHEPVSSIHQLRFAHTHMPEPDPERAHLFRYILDSVHTIRKLKSEAQLSLRTPLRILILEAQPHILEFLRLNEKLLKGIAHAENIQYSTPTSETSRLKQTDTYWDAIIVSTFE